MTTGTEQEQQMRELLEENRQLKAELENRDAQIALLRESDRELRQMKKTRLWRISNRAHNARERLWPANSRRGVILKLGGKFVRHPLTFLKKMDLVHIERFVQGIRSGSSESISARLDNYLGGRGEDAEKPECLPLIETGEIKDYDPFRVPQSLHPLISVIVPVYNQFPYTYNCLKSIALRSGDIEYEVIVADDCSTDLTTRLAEIIGGVRVVRNEKNLHFLKNCKKAAKEAKGKYVLFLNNDTQVMENWLQPLAGLMEEHEDIGMAGSKLVYPDGRLQEAGGIVWQDGSAWNYGHGQNPAAPEYNYVKEADYISGAAILIRKDLWERIGGFDERFAPAYYEDTDLAFRTRRAGYRAVYQPASTVVHFEGITNGTDTKAGEKAWQETNAKKFREKWKDILETEQNPEGRDIFRARDRSQKRKRILVVDHYVPMFDKDAGSRYMLDYMTLFLKMGYSVTFLGDNFFASQPYTQALQQMGIEVIYGDWYAQHWKEWLKSIGEDLDYVMLSRPHISIKYIDPVREASHAKILYMGHDIHFWREEMRYEKTGDPQAQREAKKWRETELQLMRKADVSIYPSELEVDKIRSIDPSITVRRWPLNIYEQVPEITYNPDEREGILFIGGFTHEPNVDGAIWTVKEIMPAVWAKRPDITLHIVGSNAPDEVLKLAGERVAVHGYTTAEELQRLLLECRMELVSLRYGGGVKGKVIEAMKNGLPIVSTPVGTQGLPGTEEFLLMGETAEELAGQITGYYDDVGTLKEMSRRETAYVRDNFSVEQAMKVLAMDLVFCQQMKG